MRVEVRDLEARVHLIRFDHDVATRRLLQSTVIRTIDAYTIEGRLLSVIYPLCPNLTLRPITERYFSCACDVVANQKRVFSRSGQRTAAAILGYFVVLSHAV